MDIKIEFDNEAASLLLNVINTFGPKKQEEMAIEEMSELTTALLHLRRKKCNKDNVIDEIADVCILMTQLSSMYGSEKVHTRIIEKLNRQVERMKINLP